MGKDGVVLGLVGSPNRDGRTNRMVRAALEGAAAAGARTELVQMADHRVEACKDCQPWVCNVNLKCSYEDPAFEFLSEKIRSCDALVLGTPIYWWDTSGLVSHLVLKMFRCFARNGPMNGLPALGIGVAGGTGNGLVTGLRPIYHFFQTLQMRAIEPLPVTRFNIDAAEQHAREQGALLAKRAREPQPFEGVEERLLWYDALPYLGLSRMGERRFLAALAVAAAGDHARPEVARGLATADALAASGNTLGAMQEITRVYNAAVKAFES
ncbi:MAG TPA: flavodoxin family protein [Chloroflexota bacterium]|nr:flavodoxin family protein [Chloroflexota bacterium]